MNDELKHNSAHIGWIKKDNVELTIDRLYPIEMAV